jgi:hypothetical protein
VLKGPAAPAEAVPTSQSAGKAPAAPSCYPRPRCPAPVGLSLLLGCGGGALAKDAYVRGMSGRTQQRVIARFRVRAGGGVGMKLLA